MAEQGRRSSARASFGEGKIGYDLSIVYLSRDWV
jgi:hypothetical protein